MNQEQGLSAVVDAAKDAGICVFVGAGVSQGAGLPSFKALVWNLVKELGVSEADFSANPDLAYWTQYYEDERDYTSLFNGVYRQLAVGNPTSIHLALTKLGTNLKAVFTTNYDSLIERSFSKRGVNYKRIIDPVHVTTGPVGTKIVHLHGHLDSPDSIVITKDQYHHARVQKRVILHLLQSISMEMPILFVGFSADDWNIRDYIAGIQHAFPDGLRRPHFAINLSSDSAALSRFQTNFACIGARVIDCSEDNPLRFTERLSEFLDQIAIDLSVARQGCDKSPSPADKTKPSVKQEAHVQRDPINIVTVGTLEHQRHEVAPTVTSLDEEDDIRTLIDDPSARLFVLSFGAVACGKTSLLGALVQGMQTPEAPGRLYVDYGLTTALRQGSYLWRTIELAFSQKAFPPRTAAGNTTRIRLEYLPESTVRASRCVINFLETSGEDFHSFQNGKHLRELPPHIQKYLMLPQSKFVFLLLCEWDHAARDDIAISDFISYVNRQEPNHFGKNYQVVFTKWDTRPEGASEATEIFRDHMPRTFNLLSQNSMAPLPFSVGTVIPFDGAPILAVTNHSYARSLFEIIYRQHTGRTTTPTSLSRVWSWLRDLG